MFIKSSDDYSLLLLLATLFYSVSSELGGRGRGKGKQMGPFLTLVVQRPSLFQKTDVVR